MQAFIISLNAVVRTCGICSYILNTSPSISKFMASWWVVNRKSLGNETWLTNSYSHGQYFLRDFTWFGSLDSKSRPF